MLTPEQLDRIVASRIELIKPYYSDGVVKPKEPKRGQYSVNNKWPEFWPGYNQSVKERDELAVHIEYGVFPDHLIHARAPNQTDKEWEYIKANFKQVTLSHYYDYQNTIARALHNFQLTFPEPAKDFEEYTRNRIGELGDFLLWAQGILIKIKTLDAMGIICTMPVKVPVIEGTDPDTGEPTQVIDPNTQAEPQPIYFPVDTVWGYEHGVWYALLTNEKSRVKYNGKWADRGLVFWVVDDQKCYRVAQTGDATKLLFDITVHFEHEQGYPPCIFLMGTPSLKEGRVVWQSNYLPAKPAFDTVLLDTTYIDMSKANSAYPYRVMLGGDCTYVAPDMSRCSGGDMWSVNELGAAVIGGKCPTCKGTGLNARLGPLGVMVVREQQRGEGTPTSVHDAMTFVEPEAHTLTFLRSEIRDQTNEGRRVMHLASEMPMQGGDVKTATQSGIDVKAQIAFVRPISDQIVSILDFTLDSMAKQRYGPQSEAMYVLVPATTFDLRTEADHLAEWTASKDLPPAMRQASLEAYLDTRYAGNTMLLDAFAAIMQADRLFVLNPMEIAAMQTARTVEGWEIALHNDALGIYERLAQEAAFLGLDKFKKADRIKAEALGMTVEEKPQTDIATKLVAATNVQAA